MSKVIVGMSGGVDSAVAAYLLKKAGYEVIGVMLRTWDDSRCCEIDDARAVAKILGIEFHAFNCLSEFRRCVVEPFAEEYRCGRTPNPCIECNRYVKFEKLIYFANVLQADHIATGHYAKTLKLPNGRYTVQKSEAVKKDQTYMLYKLSQEQLSRVMLPLGNLDKQKVREIAREAGIPVAEKKDSQEICFIPDDDYAGFITEYFKGTGISEKEYEKLEKEGDFVGKSGNILGKHKGIIHYTIGQRKGLGIAMGHPVYVCGLIPEENKVVIGEEKDLMSSKILVKYFNFQSLPEPAIGESIRGNVKIRYHHPGENAGITRISEEELLLEFDKPVKSATPGQSAVFYDDDNCIIGGGIIC